MSWSPDINFVQQYKNELTPIFQQKGSRLRSTVSVVTQNGEFAYYDRLGRATAQAITARHADTPLNDIDHTRRRNQITGYNHALLFDNQDALKMLINPTSDYAASQAWALGRMMDDVIIDAINGTAYTGKTGSGTQAFDTTNQRVAVNYVPTGGVPADSGLTVEKVRRARKILAANEVLDMGETPYFVCSAQQMDDLLGTTQVTSSDYNSVKALVAGDVDTFLGFKFVRSEQLDTTSGHRICLAYVPSAVKLGIAEELKVRINERDDKNYSIQVYSEATFGAVRMWEEAVVQVLCDE